MSDVVVGLDIGTSRVRAVIGDVAENGVFQVTGVGTSPSTGLRKGVVVNIENTVRAISQAVEAAELMSGTEVSSCMVGVGGTHIDGLNSRGVVAVTSKGRDNRVIGPEDITRVIDAAKAVVIPMDRQVLHVIPQSYIVDDERGVRDPANMIGVRLEAEVHIVTASVTSIQNVVKCVNHASLSVDEYMLHSLASAKAVMSAEERELGSILIDLGGGTTDVLVIAEGAPLMTAVIPVGGIQVTNDISVVKGISLETAERIKLDAGCCWMDLIEDNEEVILPGVGGRPPIVIPRTEICEIIQPRMEEVFNIIRSKVDPVLKSRRLSGNVVITGGGAQLSGIVELASSIFNTQAVRIGIPGNFGGLIGEYRGPDYATVLGLVLAANERHSAVAREPRPAENVSSPWMGRFRDWLKEFF